MERRSKFTDILINLFEFSKYYLLFIAIIIAIATIFGLPLLIQGESMMPNFKSGELVIVEKISYMNNKPIQRGDIVAARFPVDPTKTRLIKRVIGLPGENVEVKDSYIYINGELLIEGYGPTYGTPPYSEIQKVTLKENEYFLCGDNRPNSSDSRLWGPVYKEDIFGKVAFVLYPFKDVRYVGR